MRTAKVYYNHILAGTLIEEGRQKYQYALTKQTNKK